MIKRIITAVVLVLTTIPTSNVLAQSSTAAQVIKVHLEPTIQITAIESPTVNLGFSSVNDYVKGIQSSAQKFSIYSNKDCVVSGKPNAC